MLKKAIQFIKSIFRSNAKTIQKHDEKNAMHPGSDIIKAVETYIETPDTKYAIMIDGDWGCGKTYLWKNTLLPIIGESEALYISMYGLQDVKDIENEIFKALSMVGSDEDGILKGIIDSNTDIVEDIKVGGLGFAVQFGLKKWKESRVNKSKRLFICFDDLERWAGDIEICLSYINKLVEHEGAKCLIIGNAKEIKDKNKDSFNAAKEKTIKYKYKLSYPPSTVLSAAINITGFSSGDVEEYIRNLLNDNSNRILDLLDSVKCSNIRTLSTAIYYLSLIYSHNLKKFEQSPTSVISYFISLLSPIILVEHFNFSDEHKNIILDPSSKNVLDLTEKLGINTYEKRKNKTELTDDEKAIETLLENTFYQTDEIKHNGKFSIIKYGFYKEEKFEDEFSEWKPSEDYEYYMDTFKFLYLNDEEAHRIFNITYTTMFDDKKITHPSILLLLTDRLINDIKRGVLNLDFEETKQKARELFNALYSQKRMQIVDNIDLDFSSNRFQYCRDIYDEVVLQNQEYIKNLKNIERTKFWDKLRRNPSLMDELFYKYIRTEIFSMYDDPNEIVKIIETMDNAQLFEFTRMMGSRVRDRQDCMVAVENEYERAQAIAEILEQKYGDQFSVRAGHMKQIVRILRNKRTDYDPDYIDRIKQEKDSKSEKSVKNNEE